MIRTFIAIELPEQVKDQIRIEYLKLNSTDASIRWVKPKNLHLTLKFLGDIEEEKLKEVENSVTESVSPYNKLNLSLKGLGFFPDIKRPKVIWKEVAGDIDELLSLAESIEKNMTRIGFSAELRKFSPHITIGRIKKIKRREIDTILEMASDSEEVEFIAQNVKIIRSELIPGGAVHTTLKTINFID